MLTGHRGLAEATLFTDLDKLATGDTFTLTTFGRVMTYRVSETRVVAPEDTASLRQVEGEDLVTLVTCTPLGINTHRILVTGERVAPTPERDVRASERPAEIGFPWWIAVFLCGLGAAAIYLWRSGRPRGRERARSTAIE